VAGTKVEADEEGNVIWVKKCLKFYGMSSEEAMDKYNGGMAEYRAAEGKCVKLPYKGPVDSVVKDILGGIRSACAYVGANRLKDLSKCTTFIRTTVQENRVFS
jgi:GMP reductase